MVKAIQIIILMTLTTIGFLFANIGGAFLKPSIIGKPATYELSDIAIDSEHVFLKLYEDSGKVRGTFKSEYYLSRENPIDTNIVGLFYGVRASNVNIYEKGNSISKAVDSSTTKILDSLFLVKSRKASYRIGGDYFGWPPLSRFGYNFSFSKEGMNVLTITGNLSPADLELWGLPILFAFPFYKHPWLNSTAMPKMTQIGYLIEPISTWKKVGNISFQIEYPTLWKLDLLGFQDSKRHYQDTIIPDSKIFSGNKTNIDHKFTNKRPELLIFSIDRPGTSFFPGGPYLGIGGSNNLGFLCNISWDFAAKIASGTGAFGRIGFESNFKDYNAIVPEIQVNSIYFWLLGLKTGLPYNFNKKELSIRAGFTIDLMILGVTFNWDYLIKDRRWINGVLGTISF